jgi:fatty-acyl-CoA synthase
VVAGFKPNYKMMREEELDELRLMTGLPAALVDLRVVDENDRDVPKDGKTIGEIVARAPWIAPEYYGDPEKTRNAWRNGWFHTGDAAVWFENGYIKIVDRIKDVIKSGGEWIPSLRLEDIISTHPGVNMVAVIGVPHEKWGERPVAIVTLKPEYRGRLTPQDVLAHVNKFVEKGEIPKWWIPDKVIIVEQDSQIPLTSTGKVDKKVLREQYKDVLKS